MNEMSITDKKRILIHLHVYYTNQLDFFLNAFRKIDGYFKISLIVTICESVNEKEKIFEQIRKQYPEAIIIYVPNKGFDVGPFIETLHHVDLDDFDYVIKLHTKSRGKEGNTILNGIVISNSVWENIMIDSLIGSKERVEEAIRLLCQDHVGMAAASLCLIKDDESRRNYYFWRVNDELRKMGLRQISDKNDFRFPAGTMFVVRAKLLKPLLIYRIEEFGENIQGVHDYTLAHTFERLFSGLVISQGMTMAGLRSKRYSLELKRVEKRYQRKEKKKIGESFIDDAGLYLERLKYKVLSKVAKERIIRNSKFFDKEWYVHKHPEIIEEGINPVKHYLQHGQEYGYNPSRLFNGHEYIRRYPDLVKNRMNPLLHYECYGKYEHRSFIDNSFKWFTQVDCIRNSKLFDEKWYLQNYPDVKNAGIDPAEHYYQYGGFEGRDPSERFCTDEYLAIHRDVKEAGINPLFHYEYDGFFQGRELSSLEIKEPTFKEGTEECEIRFDRSPSIKKRTVLLASYSADGLISDSLIYLLKGLKEVADNIILIADSPILRSELSKLDGLVSYARYRRHGAYDFGSYRDGLKYLRENGYLDKECTEELIMMNDSCYGPVYPFSESFRRMANEIWDFWGYVQSSYICSFFYVFNRRIIDSRLLDEFMCRVQGKVDRYTAIAEFEMKLTKVLTEQKMISKTYVSEEELSINHRNILTLLRDYRIPLIKKKSLNGDARESAVAAMKIIERDNPDLYSLITINPINTEHHLPDLKSYWQEMPEKVRRLREKTKNGKKIKTVFFVVNRSMFPAKPLLDKMLQDELFDPKIVVIPDRRVHNSFASMMKCEEELEKEYSHEKLFRVQDDRYGRWPEVLEDADLVVYPFPYNISDFKYNVRYALGRNFLPLIVNYGFYRSMYDRSIISTYNYAYFWKIFVECEETMDEYRNYSVLKGENCDLVGYIKMDDMAKIERKRYSRKRILLALHHSVEGGYNDTLSLANYIRYYEYFETLPDKYPDIDFIYRPHPFLFEALRKAKGWDEKKTASYIEEMKNKKNVIWSDSGDYFDVFVNSDGCIQDCGSFLVEYMYTGKPCCYMLKDPKDIDEKFAPLGKECLDRCYISYNTNDIDAFIREVIAEGKDPKKESRDRFAEHIMVNYPNAADKALETIKKAILEDE